MAHHPDLQVRLARIEEYILNHSSKSNERHQAIMKILCPLSEQVKKHTLDIELIKRDRKWIYGLLMFTLSALGVAVKFLAH